MYNIFAMVEEIEIKRKVFEVIEQIGERTKKVMRKGKMYFLKDFGNNSERFEDYVDGASKCKNVGIPAPKIYMFDKNKNIVITDYIDHTNVLDMLMEKDLPEEIFDKAFLINWRAKNGKFSINFDPINFGWDGQNLYYLAQLVRARNDKWNLEGDSIYLWYYTKEFVDYLINKDEYCTFMTTEEIHEYHSMLPEKHFVSDEYPLLHERDTVDYLGKYFEKFDSKPNIVILIVEGLNEQFVHDYMDVNLMPFLRELIGSGLYWKNNFATAERSFSAVPSILGSLPYGEIGFTLLDKLPRHVTLTSILGANGYQTNFFYGQGAWFHKKNKFFQTNNISCIADNSTYSEKYPKV